MTRYYSSLWAFLAGFFLLVGCASTDVTPITADERPDQATDEAGLWQVFDNYEKELQRSALLERDEALNAYVRGIACDVTGPDYCADLRLYIINRPYFNATMSPNGLMEVWTGLLLRAENEAQAAFVIGHEFVHFHERHSLQRWRSVKNLSSASLIFSLGAAAAGAPDASALGQFAAMAALYGYGRDHEREADDKGFNYAVKAGYAASQAAALWRLLVEEVEQSDSKRKKRDFARASVFSTHPLTEERIASLDEKAAAAGDGGKTNESVWLDKVSPFWGKWLEEDLVRRDFGENIHLINRLMKHDRQMGTLYFRRAEAQRLRRGEGDLEKALADYEIASTFADAPAATWRQLGEAWKRNGENARAKQAFETYLEKSPQAEDRAFVERWLGEL